MKVHLRKVGDHTYVPDDDDAYKWSSRHAVGDVIYVDFKKRRNYEFHKKYFGMLKMAFENQDDYKSLDSLREAAQIAAGHYEIFILLDGRRCLRAKSINYNRLSQEKFEALYSAVLDVLLANFKFGEEFERELILQFG